MTQRTEAIVIQDERIAELQDALKQRTRALVSPTPGAASAIGLTVSAAPARPRAWPPGASRLSEAGALSPSE